MSEENLTEKRGQKSMPVGRPTIMTPEIRARLVEGYRLHGSHTAAAGYAGVSRQVVGLWREKFPELIAEIEHARAEWVKTEWDKIDADKSWQARRYRLSVVDRAEFAEVQKVEQTMKAENIQALDDRTAALLIDYLAGAGEDRAEEQPPADTGSEGG